VVQIALTEKGRALAAQIPVASMALFADALRSLDERDRRDLTRILRRLTDKVTELVGTNGD
jgi:DNA-binding MarR family transcriptional regulator